MNIMPFLWLQIKPYLILRPCLAWLLHRLLEFGAILYQMASPEELLKLCSHKKYVEGGVKIVVSHGFTSP